MQNRSSMKGCSKRLLGLVLVLSTAAWSQAICPMMLFPLSAESCGTQQNQPSPSAHHPKSSGHDCCPRTHRTDRPAQRESAQLSNCSSNVRCCSLEREPATPTKAVVAPANVAIVARLTIPAMDVSTPAHIVEAADASRFLRGVLSLKEDLRI